MHLELPLARSLMSQVREVKESEVEVVKGSEVVKGFEFEVRVQGDTYRVLVERGE